MIWKENVVQEYPVGEIRAWLLCLRDIAEADFGEMYALCGTERKRKIDGIRPEQKRRQSIGAGYLVALLKERFGIAEEPVVLPGGKPVFPETPGVHFNISHSGDRVVLAYGDQPLGVDIEGGKRADLRIAERFFTKKEYGYLLEQEKEAREDAFYRIWTGKEAVIKAAGGGLAIPLDRFSVLEHTVALSGKRYELYGRKLMAKEESIWISAAQLKTD